MPVSVAVCVGRAVLVCIGVDWGVRVKAGVCSGVRLGTLVLVTVATCVRNGLVVEGSACAVLVGRSVRVGCRVPEGMGLRVSHAVA